MGRQHKCGHRINWTDIEGSDGLDQRTEDNGGHSFIPITAKWLVSGTDDDDACFIFIIAFLAAEAFQSLMTNCIGFPVEFSTSSHRHKVCFVSGCMGSPSLQSYTPSSLLM